MRPTPEEVLVELRKARRLLSIKEKTWRDAEKDEVEAHNAFNEANREVERLLSQLELAASCEPVFPTEQEVP